MYDTVLVCGSLLSEGSGADARFRSSGAALTERTWKGTLRKYCRERERESEKKKKKKEKRTKKRDVEYGTVLFLGGGRMQIR